MIENIMEYDYFVSWDLIDYINIYYGKIYFNNME